MSTTRVTELQNPLTSDIDVATSIRAVRLLGSSDAMLFSGWDGLPGIFSAEMVDAATSLVRCICHALCHPSGRIIFAGCGTSGRLAHLLSRGMNEWLVRAALPIMGRFDYLIAGTDAALLLPQEAVEDQCERGQLDFETWVSQSMIHESVPVVVIGISCGLSATYVASMLQAALHRSSCVAVAVGFNPIESVKHVRVDGWSGSFYEALMELVAAGPARGIVLNPVVGPESIAGSSRMKGGSATKILLETISSLGIYAAIHAFDNFDNAAMARMLRRGYAQYESTVRCVYNEAVSIAQLVDTAAASLLSVRKFDDDAKIAASSTVAEVGRGSAGRLLGFIAPTGHGRVLYLGVGTGGLLGIIDASECYPTYGARFNDVHGFVAGGWETMQNKQGPIEGLVVPAHLRGDRSRPTASIPQCAALNLESFDRDYVPTLCADDTVVLIVIQESSLHAGQVQLAAAVKSLALAKEAGARVTHILALQDNDDADSFPLRSGDIARAVTEVSSTGVIVYVEKLRLHWSFVEVSESNVQAGAVAAAAPSFLGELAVKLVLNAVTTCAHLQRGVIFQNRMVNVSITNAKLFHRAANIVKSIVSCTDTVAETALLRAIYHADAESEVAFSSLPVSAHVKAASVQTDLVPVAVLLASATNRHREMMESAAANLLREAPVLRKALNTALLKE